MDAIVREVGADGLVSFLQDHSLGSGDYAAERADLLRRYPTAAEISADIRRMKADRARSAKGKRTAARTK